MRRTALYHSMISTCKFLLPAILLACGTAIAQSPAYKLGRTPTAVELHEWDQVVGSDGRELPPGKGSAVEGAPIFAAKCAVCHGKNGEGVWPFKGLVGGQGTLASPKPLITVGSYHPFATTIWDFINRAMPRNASRSLQPDEVYSLTAWILWKNNIIKETDVMDQITLLEVKMPNRDGFYPVPPQSAPDKDRSWLPYWNQAPGWKKPAESK